MADSGIKFGIDTSEAEKDIKRLEQEAEELDDLLSDPIEIEIDADGAKDQLGELTSLAKLRHNKIIEGQAFLSSAIDDAQNVVNKLKR
jgi:hypothetical protein